MIASAFRWVLAGVILVGLVAQNDAVAGIYLEDDRLDVYEESDPVMLFAAQATGMLMPRYGLQVDSATGEYILDIASNQFPLCPGEKFADQPIAPEALCSGVVVSSDLIIIPEYCLPTTGRTNKKRGPLLSDFAFVFGFHMTGPSEYVSRLPVNDVYFLKEVVAAVKTGADTVAIVRLDRPLVGHEPLPIRPSNEPSIFDAVFDYLGSTAYMEGLPLKTVKDFGYNIYVPEGDNASDPNYIGTCLDVMSGSAGAPVFSEVIRPTGDPAFGYLEGMIWYGPSDYEYRVDEECYGRFVYDCVHNPEPEWQEELSIVVVDVSDVIDDTVIFRGCDTLVKDRLVDTNSLSDYLDSCAVASSVNETDRCLKNLRKMRVLTNSEYKQLGACL